MADMVGSYFLNKRRAQQSARFRQDQRGPHAECHKQLPQRCIEAKRRELQDAAVRA
ncbi:hypothetical protein BOTU111922_26545 [Bordetella tumulicola]